MPEQACQSIQKVVAKKSGAGSQRRRTPQVLMKLLYYLQCYAKACQRPVALN